MPKTCMTMLGKLLVMAFAGQATLLAAANDDRPGRNPPLHWLENSRWLRLNVSHGEPAAAMAALQADLEQVHALGFNALYLSGLVEPFPAEQLRGLISEAHVRGLKVVAELELVAEAPGGESSAPPDRADFRIRPAELDSLTRTWMGGIQGGELRDGLDGWSVANPAAAAPDRLSALRSELSQINPAAVLITAEPGEMAAPALLFDAVLDAGGSACTAVDGPGGFRNQPATGPEGNPRICCPCPELEQNRWQVATAVRFLAYRMPMVDAAELGLGRPAGSKTPGSTDVDFGRRAALVHLLGSQHAQRAVLHLGEFSRVHAGKRELLTFQRAFRQDRVMVAINTGDRHADVTLTFGEPGQWVGVLTPQLAPPTGGRPVGTRSIAGQSVPVLMMTGTRLRADEWGDVAVPVDPFSARILLSLQDEYSR